MAPFKKLGWLPDLPDHRDYSQDHPAVAFLARSQFFAAAIAKRAPTVDLKQWCSPVEDQNDLGSCTAQAGAGLVEWFQNKAFGKYVNMSRLFIYKATRNLLYNTTEATGDTGAYLRNVLQELVMIGAPPEENYSYDIDCFDDEPSAFVYALAKNYAALKYLRLVPAAGKTQLETLLTTLAGAMPFIFGFTVYDNAPLSSGAGDTFPMPGPRSKVLGGHAVMAVGYDDNKKLIMIRNSWGTSWGRSGYGYLPYDYINKGLADDFWTLTSETFIDTAVFK